MNTLPTSTSTSLNVLLEPNNSGKLADLCGQFNEHIKLLESRYSVAIHSRGNNFHIKGQRARLVRVSDLLKKMYQHCLDHTNDALNLDHVHLFIQEDHNHFAHNQGTPVDSSQHPNTSNIGKPTSSSSNMIAVQTPRKTIESRGKNQNDYLCKIEKHDINFGIGPAGTGKTYLAVACAVAALKQEHVGRIVLVRPAVEAGEKLGFLPGDLQEKINPYLRPLYDALYEMLGFETVEKMIEKEIIEIAPLAYMRGRTLNDAFIILDESQNTTKEQMKMFLTRIGFGAKAIITGDITQIDLPRGTESGLAHAIKVLADIKEIGVTHFSSQDIVRHKLVQKIVDAYDLHQKKTTLETMHNKKEASDTQQHDSKS